MQSIAKVAVGAALATSANAYVVPGSAAPSASAPAQVVADFTAPEAAAPVEETTSSWSPLAFGAALGLMAAVVGGQPAMAADIENGGQIFSANCAACHAGGNNAIVPEKKLKKEALLQYGKYEIAQIITQVTNGNGAMPAFGEKIAPDDIEDVANYVRSQADKGW